MEKSIKTGLENIEIELVKKIQKPIVIMAFSVPGISLAPIIASGIFIDKLKMTHIGRIDSELLPPVMGIMNGKVHFPNAIYHYNDEIENEIMVIIGPAPIPNQTYQFCKELMDWLESLEPKEIVIFSTVAADTELQALGAATEDALLKKFKDLAQIEPATVGALTLHSARLMAECLRRKIAGIVLMAVEKEQEKGAVFSLLEALNKVYLEGKINFREEIEKIDILPQQTISSAAIPQFADTNIQGYG